MMGGTRSSLATAELPVHKKVGALDQQHKADGQKEYGKENFLYGSNDPFSVCFCFDGCLFRFLTAGLLRRRDGGERLCRSPP